MHLTVFQILAITCDNASSNDAMMLELEDRVDHFDGQVARARCFLHVGNLVGQSMVKAFDIPRNTIENDNEMQTLDTQALSTEDWQTIAENSEDPLDNDDVEGWVDEIPLLTREERRTLENQVRPVRIALAKVS